jgi:glucose-6-phosphate dehydrogenase assembly protein OpcA
VYEEGGTDIVLDLGAESAVCLVSQVTAADSRAIDEGLHELWRLAGAGETSGALVRAASMTLVIPVVSEAQADELSTTLDALNATHPSRAVLLLADERVDEPRVRLASHYRRSGDGEAPRYWEEIRVAAPPASLHRVLSAIGALQLPGLPVQAWWPGEPSFETDLYNQVVEVSDRILVDSGAFRTVSQGLPALDSAIEGTHESVAFADLSWTRLTAWRILVAEFFDASADQEMLDSIEAVRIEYASGAGGAAAGALLFAGWLGSRLGWEPRDRLSRSGGNWCFNLLDGVRPVRVEIAGRRRESHQLTLYRGLQRIAIEAAEDGRRSTYTVERHGDGGEARAVAETQAGRLERHTRLPADSQAELLREELGLFATDRIYREALQLSVRLLRT